MVRVRTCRLALVLALGTAACSHASGQLATPLPDYEVDQTGQLSTLGYNSLVLRREGGL